MEATAVDAGRVRRLACRRIRSAATWARRWRPVADLISVPFQNNFNFGAGAKEETIYVLNVQPVIPIKLTPQWNLITRTIVPILNQPSLFPGPGRISESAFGLG
jgi:hypothetical protein